MYHILSLAAVPGVAPAVPHVELECGTGSSSMMRLAAVLVISSEVPNGGLGSSQFIVG